MKANIAAPSDGPLPRATEVYVARRRGIPGRLRPAVVLMALAAAAALGGCGNGSAEDRGTADGPPAGREAAGQASTDSPAGAGADARPADTVPRLTTLDVAGHTVKVEVADDDEERSRGLMHRDSLPPDQGMLFVYPEEQTLSFWMRNTEIPLDIAYIDEQGFIVDIQQMDPHTEELHPSSRPAMYALEMRQGWFEAHGVSEGDRVGF